MGYRRRTGFLAGLTVAQISEFSLILGALGMTLGHIDQETMGLITLVGLVTIGLSTYLILYSHRIYDVLAGPLGVFERAVPHRERGVESLPRGGADVVIFGLGRYGSNIARQLRRSNLTILGVDFDPQMVSEWQKRGQEAQYGDASDPEFPASLPLSHVRWIVCAVPDIDTNLTLLRALREHQYQGKTAVTAHTGEDATLLQRSGADMVMMPYVDAADRAANQLSRAMEVDPARKPDNTITEGPSDE
jgi:hypothetical protein